MDLIKLLQIIIVFLLYLIDKSICGKYHTKKDNTIERYDSNFVK